MISLTNKASELRRTIFETAVAAGTGHIPGCMSWVEIAVALYYGGVMNFRPSEPEWPARDRFILSKGHAVLTQYAVLADLGFISREELGTFAKRGSRLPCHPSPVTPGIECHTGSLGHGLGIGVGMALSAKLSGVPWRTFVVLGDGECAEGSVWEAAAFASSRQLNNLVAIVDCNHFGATEQLTYQGTPLALRHKFTEFGWDTGYPDGHDFESLIAFLKVPHKRPFALIADTTKGKGIPFMENSAAWHHQNPKGEQIEEARRALA